MHFAEFILSSTTYIVFKVYIFFSVLAFSENHEYASAKHYPNNNNNKYYPLLLLLSFNNNNNIILIIFINVDNCENAVK